jgi:hypothetical protein
MMFLFLFHLPIDSNLASIDDSCSTAEFGLLRSLLDCSQIPFRSRISSIVGLHLACPSGDIDLLFTTLRAEVCASEMQTSHSTETHAICHTEMNERTNE